MSVVEIYVLFAKRPNACVLLSNDCFVLVKLEWLVPIIGYTDSIVSKGYSSIRHIAPIVVVVVSHDCVIESVRV